jgi:hypothetical protein
MLTLPDSSLEHCQAVRLGATGQFSWVLPDSSLGYCRTDVVGGSRQLSWVLPDRCRGCCQFCLVSARVALQRTMCSSTHSSQFRVCVCAMCPGDFTSEAAAAVLPLWTRDLRICVADMQNNIRTKDVASGRGRHLTTTEEV